ncbi:MAG: prepilin-type N-terminal cleavage/methylation domain-containing protein [Gemmatimonadales bacterium]|jgi:type IV pilus assembly protein PilA|nr:MAG: prepilin-type N-terminal cleavage/methylation domain-containing protein [Gemmatimonadales bacterium]
MREDIRQDEKNQAASSAEASRAFAPAGRAGFTLIELLIVVVIIGILAAIAIPKFASTKERAYLAKMKGDLRNLATAQEAYNSDNQTYYGGAIPNPILSYNPSSGTTITIAEATPGGWSATATYAGTVKTCALFFGSAAAVAPAVAEGLITCDL